MTVQDLMRHSAGLVYGARGTGLVYQAYREAKIGDRTATIEEFVARLSKLPLNYNPGDRWEYSVAVDVQGRLLEVLNGKPLREVLGERIFRPLAMTDTFFQVAGRQACARGAARSRDQRQDHDRALQGR